MNKKLIPTFLASLLFLSIFSAGVLAQPWYLYDGDDGVYNVTSNDNFYGFPTRREAGNYSGGVTPYIGEDPDQDSSLSDFYIGNESGFTTFIDGVKNQTKVGDFSEHPGLVSYWPLDNDNAWDPISGNNGTLNGGVTTGASGQVSKAMDFDGVDDYVGSTGALITGSQDRTITAWIKPNFTNIYPVIISWGEASTTNDYTSWIVRLDSANNYQLRVEIQGTGYTSSLQPTEGEWNFIAVKLNGTTMGDHVLYLNNQSEAVPADPATVNTGSEWSTYIGVGVREVEDIDSGKKFSGSIDDVRIYDRALSSAEIQALYDAEKPTAGNDPTLGAEETSGGGGNSAPEITITDPTNTTYFDYDIPVDVNTSDPEGDTYDCNVSMDGGITGKTNKTYERFYTERDKEKSWSYSGTFFSNPTNNIVDEDWETSDIFSSAANPGSGDIYQNMTIPMNKTLYWTIKYKIDNPGNLEGFCWNGSNWESFYYDDTNNGVETNSYKISNSCLLNSLLQIKEHYYESGGYVKYYEGKVLNKKVREILGSHTLDVICEDSNSNTNSDSVSYTVDNYEFQSQNGGSSVYETSNQSYGLTVYTGDMVNSINATLLWNGTERNYNYVIHSGISNETLTSWFELPLVETNTTTENWNFEYDVNYNLTDGSNTTSTETTSSRNQDVLWAYWINQTYGNVSRMIEEEPLGTYTNLITKESGATLSVDTTFNGTTKQDTQTSYSTYENSFTTPKISPLNKTFTIDPELNVTFDNETKLRDSTTGSVDVYKTLLTDCSGSNPVALNFSLWDETNLTAISGSLASTQNVSHANSDISRQYTFSKSGSHYQEICIYPPWTEYIVNTKSSEYDATDYKSNKYFLSDANVDNQTDNIKIYLSKGALYFTFKVEDKSGVGVDDVLVKFKRYYPANNTYKLVSSAKTSADGYSATYLELENIPYQVVLQKNGSIIKTYSSRYYSCNSDPCHTFTTDVEEIMSSYDYREDINFNCYYQESNMHQICEVEDPEGLTNDVCLVGKTAGIATDEIYEKTCDESSSMTLMLNLTDASEANQTVEWNLVGYDGDKKIILTSGRKIFGTGTIYGLMGVLLSFVLLLILASVGYWNPAVGIGMSTLAVIVSWQLGILSITWGPIGALVVTAVILIYKVRT